MLTLFCKEAAKRRLLERIEYFTVWERIWHPEFHQTSVPISRTVVDNLTFTSGTSTQILDIDLFIQPGQACA